MTLFSQTAERKPSALDLPDLQVEEFPMCCGFRILKNLFTRRGLLIEEKAFAHALEVKLADDCVNSDDEDLAVITILNPTQVAHYDAALKRQGFRPVGLSHNPNTDNTLTTYIRGDHGIV